MISEKSKKGLYKKSNVIGMGKGNLVRKGNRVGKGLVVTVTKKLPLTELKSEDVVPRSVEGIQTDVIEVGDIKPLAVDRTKMHRPFPMGVSIGHKDITAGTAGCLVEKNGVRCVLSNNHVLANSNAASVGDAILQPGKYDGGVVGTHEVARLLEFVEIEFMECQTSNLLIQLLNFIAKRLGSGVKFNYTTTTPITSNLMDAAIAQLLDESIAEKKQLELGHIVSVGVVDIDDIVKKSGRTTAVTTMGPVIMTDYEIMVSYGEGKQAYFTSQMLIEKEGFSAGGDSGSVIVKGEGNVLTLVGLLFAGSETHTIASHIGNVIDVFGITVITQ